MKLFEKCNIFFRSFTNKGLGYTFNNEVTNEMFKIGDHKKVIDALNINYQRKPKMMTSAGAEHSLNVLLDLNAEEVKNFLIFKDYSRKPRKVSASLHSSLEPANLREVKYKLVSGKIRLNNQIINLYFTDFK